MTASVLVVSNVPPGVVTMTVPVVVPSATTAVSFVSERTVTSVASVPPMFTPVAPRKSLPVSVIVAPVSAPTVAGENDVIVGSGQSGVKVSELFTLVFGLVTEIATGAVPTPCGTTAVTLVSESTLKLAAGVDPKSTALTYARCFPVIVTVVPGRACAGANDVIVGGSANVAVHVSSLLIVIDTDHDVPEHAPPHFAKPAPPSPGPVAVRLTVEPATYQPPGGAMPVAGVAGSFGVTVPPPTILIVSLCSSASL